MMMKGHQGAILELAYAMDGTVLFSASSDKQGAVWDLDVGVRVKKLKGHSSFVNSIASSQRGDQVAATGSDDGTARIWDLRSRFPVQTLQSTYQVTCVSFNTASDLLLTGGLDNVVKVTCFYIM
jgi:Prp8 binding protein